jgi:hypothetical protein
MSNELGGARRIAIEHLITVYEAAIERDDIFAITHETILKALQQVQRGWVSAGQAARILAETAARVSDKPEKVALSPDALCQ